MLLNIDKLFLLRKYYYASTIVSEKQKVVLSIGIYNKKIENAIDEMKKKSMYTYIFFATAFKIASITVCIMLLSHEAKQITNIVLFAIIIIFTVCISILLDLLL